MKRIVIFSISIFMVALLLAGCGKANSKDSNTNTQSIKINQEENNDFGIVYETPVNTVKISFSDDDPSNDQIQFSYDENNRISQCQYQIDGHAIKLVYSYSGNSIHIYAFSDDYVAADETFNVSSYDVKEGFTSYNGYYFCGCIF